MKNAIIFCALFILLGTVSFCVAQAPDILWTRTYGGTDNDYAYDLKQTSDGGYILAGSGTFGAGWWDIYLIKTDANGDTIWTQTFEAVGPDWVSSIQQTDDDGYIITCDGFADLIKLNEFGDSVWSQDYGIIANSVWQTDDGGYIVGGGAVEGTCLIKTDSLGNVIWNRVYGDENFGAAIYVQQTYDGGYMAVGTAYSEQNWFDYYLIKTNSSGDTLWTRTYGSNGPEEAYSAQQTADGGYIITGLFFWTVKTDPAGDTVWCRYYGYGEMGCAFSIQETHDVGYIIGGYIDPPGIEEAQFYLVKTDPFGNEMWESQYGGDGWDFGYKVRQTDDGGYIMTGWTNSFGIGGMDIWLLRLGYPVGFEEMMAPVPDYMSLLGNYPNPFNSSTTIEFIQDKPQFITLTIYDLLGREIKTLLNERKPAGKHKIPFDASPLSSGVYFYRLQAGDAVETKRMVLLK
ncbi:MAG: T9SS type A sorting domain-containing protein [Candidatus Zixiibacteriota bacterium]|nr:MAG: T9SS type A sorting domain-containing protein [candidate division Zixibacteria bacterium]